MALRDLKLKKIYRVGMDSFDKEFLIPALSESKQYDRGVGYFSLATLAELADGIIPLIKRDGRIRIVTSVKLSLDDIELIKKGYVIKQELVETKIKDEIRKILSDDSSLVKLDLITNLIAADILKIKIAYTRDEGIYHEKIGFLSDYNEDVAFFCGSNNETYSGYNRNVESAVLLYSWKGDVEDIYEQQHYFEDLWNDHLDWIKTFEFPEALKYDIFSKYKKSENVEQAISRFEDFFDTNASKNKRKELYDYQKKAVDEFVENGFCHFFEMATGTGKTFTAVKAVEKMYKTMKNLSVLVLVPQIDLQKQWVSSFSEINAKSVCLGGIASASQSDFNFDNFVINSFNGTELNIAISTYDTFFSKYSMSLEGLPEEKMIIVDEAHNLSPAQIRSLPKQFKYRLGLSATPERYDKSETAAIIDFFTHNTVETYKYTIEEAIQNDFLSKYEYHPVFVQMDSDDYVKYQSFSKKIIAAHNEENVDEAAIVDLMIKRSNIVKKASTKLEKLAELVQDTNYSFNNAVVYCGSGKDSDSEELIIDKASRILATKYRVSQFTSRTIDRPQVLKEFENDYFDTLIAIKCFDEGVDVPKLDKIYILASDTLNRQTVQRRGRVLRKCRERGKTIALIYDFVVLPPDSVESNNGFNSLIKNEFRRVFEYNRLAMNERENEDLFDEVFAQYNVSRDEMINEAEEDIYGRFQSSEDF